MAVFAATMMSLVHFVILAVFFLFLKDLMIQFIRLIDRVLSAYALLTKGFISC
jgi:uncharacterized membrane protein YhaH (DUF805 family)